MQTDERNPACFTRVSVCVQWCDVECVSAGWHAEVWMLFGVKVSLRV